jgi:indole-3-glycerol phosphate synthase
VDFLASIARDRRERIREEAGKMPLAEIRERAEVRRGDARPFAASLRREPGGPIRAIAEVKRASPSAGVLQPEYDPGGLGAVYAEAGAAAVSVLTEPSRFGGSLEDLSRVRGRVTIPVLQKDFIVDERQIYAARAEGADAVLLIVALVEPARLRDYAALAGEIGLEVLVEIHEERELERALEVAGAIGVNNRDLRTLEMRRGWAERVLRRVPPDRVRVAESGYRERSQIEILERLGADAVLVGESLLRAASPGDALRALLAREARARNERAGDR